MRDNSDALNLLTDLVARARARGADQADALAVEGASLSVGRRLGKAEKLERSESVDLGLRVLVGQRQAVVSSTDRSPAALDALAERAVAMARAVPDDPHAGLADPSEIARAWPDLDMHDPDEPSTEALIALASDTEAAALAVPGVTNSEGAEAGWGASRVALVASNGFAGAYARSHIGVSVSVVAGEGLGMETDYDYASAVWRGDLKAASEVGRSAGERAVKRLGARKVETAKVPVVFDPRVASGLLGSLSGAISGSAVARGTSFLKAKLGQRVFAPGITVIDDPHLRRGLRSRAFDGEGVLPKRRAIIEDGVLTTWLMDLRSARQLGLGSTGHASRGTGGPPAPSPANLWLDPGTLTPAELMRDIKNGFYVTSLMGQGVNMVTGDYSRGASGFWIENGRIAYPVAEVTIAGNLADMFLNLVPANDFERRTGIDSPTVRVEGMTLAGR